MTVKTHDVSITVVDTSQILDLPWQDLHGVPGARTKVLWRADGSLAGLLRLEPGTVLRQHTHSEAEHHVYVLEGRCWLGTDVLVQGTYAHVPAGVAHEVRGGLPDGCRLIYLYAPVGGES